MRAVLLRRVAHLSYAFLERVLYMRMRELDPQRVGVDLDVEVSRE